MPTGLVYRRCDVNVSRHGAYVVIDVIQRMDPFSRVPPSETPRGSASLAPDLFDLAAGLWADVGGNDPSSVYVERVGDFTGPDGVRSSKDPARRQMFARIADAVRDRSDHVLDVLLDGTPRDRLHASFLLQAIPHPEAWIARIIPAINDEVFPVRNNVSLFIGYALPGAIARLDATLLDRLVSSWCSQLLLPTPFDRGKAAENLVQLVELAPHTSATIRARCSQPYIDHLASVALIHRDVFLELQSAVAPRQ